MVNREMSVFIDSDICPAILASGVSLLIAICKHIMVFV